MPEQMPIITLLTDFGMYDSYVAQMKGVILQKNPGAQIVDMSHEIPPQDILRAAYVLGDSYAHFPRGTIHIVVVDPGVGSDRRVLGASAARQLFLAPDNGVLELVLKHYPPEAMVDVANRWYFQQNVSNTFHGRDIFASVASHLAAGVKLSRLGPPVDDPVRLQLPEPTIDDNRISGSVIYADRFGNLVTDIERKHLARVFQGAKSSQMFVRVGEREIHGLWRSYASQHPGELMSLLGSSGRLEISVSGGSAAAELDAPRGTPVEVLRQ